jgi:peptidoglycan/xylan/chitin deacetylase (PgdA/CDA1 family)
MTPEVFEAHLNFLNRSRYSIISAVRLFAPAAIGQHPHPVVLTFDDGCDNFYTEAFPRLSRHGCTATVFVVTDWIGKKGYLNWPQLSELHSAGITIGSHSCSHPHLPDLDPVQMKIEITRSKEILEQKLGTAVTLFCYPFGGFSVQAVEFVRAAGYKTAFTTNRGLGGNDQDILFLRRIRMSNTVHPIHLWAKCSGYYDLFRKPRPSH